MRLLSSLGLVCVLCVGCSESSGSGGVAAGGAGGAGAAGGEGGSGGAPAQVTEAKLTFLGVTQWLVTYGETAIFFDAYFSRPEDRVGGSTEEGLDLMQRVLDEAGLEAVDYILVGHSHFDHAIDAGSVAMLTGAQVIGSKTTCFVAQSAGLPEERCTIVGTGDEIQLGEARMRAVRTIHTLPESIGLFLELEEVPTPEESWGAPAGGPISYLLSFSGEEPFSLFYTNSVSPIDGDDGSGEDYRANLEGAFVDVNSTTAWLGPVSFLSAESDLMDYFSAIRPEFVVPHHFDGLSPDIEGELTQPFAPQEALTKITEEQGITIVAPTAYFQQFTLTPAALTAE